MADVNDLIASGIRPPQVEDMQTVAARGLTLQNLAQQRQLGQQQLQSGQLELQQKQQDFQDQQKIRQLYMDTGGDLDKLQTSAMKSGVSPRAVMAIQQQKLAMQKEFAGYDEVRLKNDAARHDQLRGQLNSFLAQDDATKAASWQPWIQGHVQSGALTAAEGQQLLQQHPAYPGDDVMKVYGTGLATGSQYAEEEIKRRDAAAAETSANARQTTAGVASDKAQREKDALLLNAIGAATNQAELDQARFQAQKGGISPAALGRTPAMFSPAGMQDFNRGIMTAEQRTQADQAALNGKNTEADRKITQEQGAQRLKVEQGRLKVEQDRYGFDAAGGVSPAAKAAANGDMSPQTLRMMLRGNPGLMNQIKTIDPDFSETNIENRYNTLKEFTSTSNGKAGGQALALNTLIHHADLYLAAADALKNHSFVPGNQIYNAVAQAFGSAPPTNAALLARFFAGETGKVATGGVPAEGEINGILKNLSTNASPEQIAGAGKTLLGIAAGRMQPLQERVNNAKLGNVVQVLGPDAKSILSRRGFDPATMKPAAAAGMVNLKAPDGTTKSVPADQLDHYLKLGAQQVP